MLIQLFHAWMHLYRFEDISDSRRNVRNAHEIVYVRRTLNTYLYFYVRTVMSEMLCSNLYGWAAIYVCIYPWVSTWMLGHIQGPWGIKVPTTWLLSLWLLVIRAWESPGGHVAWLLAIVLLLVTPLGWVASGNLNSELV